MNYDRVMGVMWGVLIGVCFTLGVTHYPVMILVALVPMFGVWLHRHVH